MRIYVYIDGFNLYYAIKNTPYKWLNIKKLANEILPNKVEGVIHKVKYFTARVSGSTDKGSPRRQQIYFKALSTVPEIEIHTGHFLSKSVWRPLIGLPVADDLVHLDDPIIPVKGSYLVTDQDSANERMLEIVMDRSKLTRDEKKLFYRRKPPTPHAKALLAEVHSMEEKGSDVNLATHLLNDAWQELFDMALVISNDTDLVTPIKIVVEQRKLPVAVINPTMNRTPSAGLKRVASTVWHVRKEHYERSQFPDRMEGGLSKPSEWVN
ncbi:MAG: NYN domain-containing protein [Candidatus Thiodiazotropha endolucinida]